MVIAVDIALIPSDEVIDLCLDINKAAWMKDKGRFRMSRQDRIPHVSLAMGFIEDEDIDELKNQLSVMDHTPFNVDVLSLDHIERDGLRKAWLSVEVTDELRALHAKMFGLMRPYLVKSGSADGLFEGERTGINPTSLNILNNYDRYAFENYKAHITLCCYDADSYASPKLPVSFMADRIALCHLGDGCTCRRVLEEYYMKS